MVHVGDRVLFLFTSTEENPSEVDDLIRWTLRGAISTR